MLHRLKNWIQGDVVTRADLNAVRNLMALDEMGIYPGMGMRHDGWYSNQLGHGTAQDKSEMMLPFREFRRSRGEIDSLYKSSGLVQRIINLPCNDMTRRGIKIEHDYGKEIQDGLKKLNVWQLSNKAARYGRAFRLGGIVFDIPDGRRSDEPVDLKKLKGKSINVIGLYDSDRLQPYGFNQDAAEPEMYRVLSTNEMYIHKDRIMAFDGIDCGINNRIDNSGMGESIIDAIYAPLRNVDVDYKAASSLTKDYRQKVIKMAGFGRKATGNTSEDVNAAKRRYQVLQRMMSIMNAIVVGEADDVQYVSSPVNGYAELVKLAKEYLCMVTGIPHSKLFNEDTTGGLNGGGMSAQNDWINVIEDLQASWFAPQLDKAVAWVAATLGIFEAITYKFNKLVPLSEKEEAEVDEIRAKAEKARAEADAVRIASRVLTADEVRQARYVDNQGDNAHRIEVTGPAPVAAPVSAPAPAPASVAVADALIKRLSHEDAAVYDLGF